MRPQDPQLVQLRAYGAVLVSKQLLLNVDLLLLIEGLLAVISNEQILELDVPHLHVKLLLLRIEDLLHRLELVLKRFHALLLPREELRLNCVLLLVSVEERAIERALHRENLQAPSQLLPLAVAQFTCCGGALGFGNLPMRP